MKKLAGLGVLIFLIILMAVPAEAARSRQRSGTYSTGRGKSGTFQRSVNREGRGNVSRNSTWINQDGKTGSRSRERTWDKESGTGTYQSSFSGANGKERSASGTIAKTDTGYTTTGTRTNAKGETFDVNRTVTKNGDGTVSVNKVVTNDAGQDRTVGKTITKTEDGRSVTGNYTTFNGQAGTLQKDVVRKDGVRTVTSSATNQDGETATRVKTLSRDGDTVTRGVTSTGFKGRTRSGTQTATAAPAAAEASDSGDEAEAPVLSE